MCQVDKAVCGVIEEVGGVVAEEGKALEKLLGLVGAELVDFSGGVVRLGEGWMLKIKSTYVNILLMCSLSV